MKVNQTAEPKEALRPLWDNNTGPRSIWTPNWRPPKEDVVETNSTGNSTNSTGSKNGTVDANDTDKIKAEMKKVEKEVQEVVQVSHRNQQLLFQLINLEASATPRITYPAKDSHSVIVPYSQREHAWTERQDDLTHPQ